jgi:hypothetical protein
MKAASLAINGGRARYPFVQPDGRSYTYSLDTTPNHRRLLDTGIMISVGAFYTDQDIEETAAGILKVFRAYCRH